ncbi:MAG: alpha/beta fold hydrolase [Candidatus Eremiobacteraeota bacterium]|nr:alpha/beta fold hydrolase [Candidatus Eremiobacteraeota bacterium]
MIENTVDIGRLCLLSGDVLEAVQQRVTIYGDPATAGRIVLVCHTLSGDSRASDWWAPLIGPGRLFDPAIDCVVCINVLGSCYGSTGPQDTPSFPDITIADMVHAQARALYAMGINHLDLVIGGSLGGMQALQWAISYPQRVEQAVVIAAYDYLSAQGIGFNALAREAITVDPARGLALARKIATLTYKSEAFLEARHGNRRNRDGGDLYDIEGYLDHLGRKFARRMAPAAYVTLTRAMDSFDLRNVDTICTNPTMLFVGISSDWLFVPSRVRDAAARLQRRGFRSHYAELQSTQGHDAFLSDADSLVQLLQSEGLGAVRRHDVA